MKILWIEDFGASQPLEANGTTLGILFREIFGSEILAEWSDENKLNEKSSELSRFCKDHSLPHEVNLVKNYGEFLQFEKSSNQPLSITDDIVVIDIDLSHGVDPSIPIPEGYSPEDFHKRAGIYIFNHLVRKGFDPENICFLTANADNTFDDFKKTCIQGMVPIPKDFLKASDGYLGFRNWLSDRCKRPYLVLRRGILDGCEWLKGESVTLRFPRFCGEKEMGILGDGKLYLDTLASLLPQREPDHSTKLQAFNVFLRSLAHIWETQAKPHLYNKRTDLDGTLALNFAWIMKNLRNWTTHEARIGDFSSKDVAFFFLVNMRAIFLRAAPGKPQKDVWPYETQLLSLFYQTQLKGKAEEVQIALYESYARAKNLLVDAMSPKRKPGPSAEVKTPRDAIAFHKIVANLRESCVSVEDPRFFIKALALQYWHGFCEVRSKRIEEKWHGTQTDKFFKAEFSWNFDLWAYLDQGFQKEFSEHVFKYCFFEP